MDPEKLKVVELRTELAQRGLDTKGVKSVLVERLRKVIEEENANQGHQGTIIEEEADDDVVQEYDDRATKSTKAPQTPKKSGRLSKAAPMTPREDPVAKKRRTSRMSYSRRKTSPKKSDQNDMSREPSPVPSESTLHDEGNIQEDVLSEADAQQEINILEKPEIQETPKEEKLVAIEEAPMQDECIIEKEASKQEDSSVETETPKLVVEPESPSKNKETERKSFSDLERENVISVETVKDETQKIEVVESNEDKSDLNPSQASAAESPTKCSPENDPTTVELKDNENDDNTIEESVENNLVKDVTENTEASEPEAIVSDANQNEEQDADNTREDTCQDIKKDVQDEEENLDSVDSNDTSEIVDENKLLEIDSEEQSKYSLDEEQDIDINENDKLEPEDQFMEDKESVKEAGNIANYKRDDEDIEMSELKHDEDTDIQMKEAEDNNVIHDKKRKRSSSPQEYRQESPPPVLVENEPEIDDAALILSWYDSDLNLVIDKDGYFTATPMHNDGFSHMWAGARASYGFLCGKVYYEAKIVEYCAVNTEKEEHPHVLRIGWSTPYTSMQLGEEKFSFGYSSTGKKLTDNKYEDYGVEFEKDDVICCYCDATSDNVILSYTVNGKEQGTAFSISKEELGDKPLFPHILSKNCTFACNFGQETPWDTAILQDYVSIGNVESQYKIPGLRRPEKKEECEVIMMCGLPACGKTTWATKYASEHPEKMYNILGLSSLINKMKDPEQSYTQEYEGQWKKLIDKCADALDRLMEIASSRRRNYILDQTPAYPSAQRRKMKNFSGYQRKAVVIVPPEEEYMSRTTNHKTIEGKEVTDSMLLEMKANFRAPLVGESFDVVDWVELDEEEGGKLIVKYNKEGKEAGYGEQQLIKRARIDSRSGTSHDSRNDARSNRDNRDNRDYRDRRNSYSDRNRNPVWRGGGGNMGWRDRPQRGGGPMRHGGGYGPPLPRRRRGAPIRIAHRGMNRRGGTVDRRGGGSDRGRALGSHQGPRSRAPMGNYQGSQQPVWNQQGSWATQSSDGWGPQNNRGSQSWSTWKSYGHGSYNQNNYQSGGYGNGNWNSWNQQYYNQYWGQQQQSGQTTTTSGQAANKQ